MDEVLQLRPNNKPLQDFIQAKYKKLVTLKDIQNLKKTGGRNDEQILVDALEDALAKDTGAKGGITVNENNEIDTVLYQSAQMCVLFEKFPQYIVGGWYL